MLDDVYFSILHSILLNWK